MRLYLCPCLQIKSFLKEMGQPIDSAAFRAIVFDEEEVSGKLLSVSPSSRHLVWQLVDISLETFALLL